MEGVALPKKVLVTEIIPVVKKWCVIIGDTPVRKFYRFRMFLGLATMAIISSMGW